MNNKNYFKKIILLILVVSILVFVLFFFPTRYNLMSPGVAENLSHLIEVENGIKEHEGTIYLTAVSTPPASIWDYFYVTFFNPNDRELILRAEQIPPEMDIQEYHERIMELMEESKRQAQAVAFERAGLEYEVTSEGIKVVDFIEGGSAKDYLQRDDIITAIDNKSVVFATDTSDLIQNRNIGDQVTIDIIRNKKEKTFTMETVELDANPGRPSVGILIVTSNLEFNFPREVYFDTEGIGGSSAGSMFVLEIFNQLTEQDITGGYKIAGTGSITIDGEIHPIGGTRYKIMTAREKGANYFILPDDNYEEIENATQDIEIVPVNNIEEIFSFLENIEKAS